MKVYKIFETYLDGSGIVFPCTLFHGIYAGLHLSPGKRSRVLPIDRWLDAEARAVKDGSGGPQYISGFHCYTNLDAVKAWFKTGSPINRVVALVEIGPNHRQKNRAVRHTLLADKMIIRRADWETRIDAESMMSAAR